MSTHEIGLIIDGQGRDPYDETLDDALRTSWAPVSMEEILAGDYEPSRPTMGARVDGRCLIYPGRIHAFHAEPEALKTWFQLWLCAERLERGEDALFLDFEDSAPSIVQRLLDLGASSEAISSRFHYIRPDEALSDHSSPDFDAALATMPTLVVIDGLTEAFSVQGLSPLDNSDIATWLDILPRRIIRTCPGAAVNTLDHVVKDREQRGRYAIGGQHKLAGVDVAYSMRVIEPFGRGHDGVVSIRIEKDRPGGVREFATDGQVALLRARSLPDGKVSISLDPPEHASGGFRPTVLMERISRAVEATSGLSKRALRETVHGKSSICDLALELLIAEGFVAARRDGQKHVHSSVRPFREEADRDPVTQRDPTVTQSQHRDRDPVTPPLLGSRSRGAPEAENHLYRDPSRPDGFDSPASDDGGDEYDALIARHRDIT